MKSENFENRKWFANFILCFRVKNYDEIMAIFSSRLEKRG